jgi:hypothetical protein
MNRHLASIFALLLIVSLFIGCNSPAKEGVVSNKPPAASHNNAIQSGSPGSAKELVDDLTKAGIIPGRPLELPAGTQANFPHAGGFHLANGYGMLNIAGTLELITLLADSKVKPNSETATLPKFVVKTKSGTDLFSLTKEEVLAEYGPPSDGFDLGKEEGLESSIPGSDYKKPKPGTTFFLSYDFVTGEKAEVSIGFSFELKAHDEMMLTRLTLRYVSHNPSSLSIRNKDLPLYDWSKAK